MDSQVDCTPAEKEEILRLVRSRTRAQRRKLINVCAIPQELLKAVIRNFDVNSVLLQCYANEFGWVAIDNIEILSISELVSINHNTLPTPIFEALIIMLLEDPVLAKHRWVRLTIRDWAVPLLCAIVADGTIWTAKALTGLDIAEPDPYKI